MTDEPKSLGALLFELPAVRRAKKVNTLSRVHRRLIEPIETEQDKSRACPFSTQFFVRPVCPIAIPATTCASGSVTKAQCLYLSKPVKLGTPRAEIGSSSACRGERSRA
jgi:hypothetical protein